MNGSGDTQKFGGSDEYEIVTDQRGVKYYFNKETQITTSAKPDCLKIPDELFRVRKELCVFLSSNRTYFSIIKICII